MSAPGPRPLPTLAGWLLRLLLPPAMREYAIGDLTEQYYQRIRPRHGPLRARLWLWRQVWDSLLARTPVRVALASPMHPNRASFPRASSMDAFLQDFRFAVRQLSRYPGFALTVVFTLAMGIGANTAIFSVVHGVVMRPLPYPDSESLFALYVVERTGSGRYLVPDPDFAALLEQAEDLRVAAIDETIVMPLSVSGTTEGVALSRVYHEFFRVLGVAPALGRDFRPADGEPSETFTPAPLILSHSLWRQRFGADPQVLGRSVELMGAPAIVVGVMPEGFAPLLPPNFGVGEDIQVWTPSRYDYAAQERDQSTRVVGRSATGLVAAQRELDAVSGRLAETDTFFAAEGYRFAVEPLLEEVVGNVRPTLLLLLGAVGFVLLIACANVANLLMVRGAARRGEFAVRAALGAGRRRLLRQSFTESLLLSALGMLAGTGLAFGAIRLLQSMGPANLPRLHDIRLDGQVLAFGIVLTGAATLAYGLVPALRYARATGAVGSERSVAGDRPVQRLQGFLVVAQVALSIVLVSGTALMLRSVREMHGAPIGLEPEGLVTFRTNIIGACPFVDGQLQGCDRSFRMNLEETIRQRLLALPGVEEVGAGFPLPMNGIYSRVAAYTPEALSDEESERRQMYFRPATGTFFAAMGIDLVAGRTFVAADGEIDEGTRRIIVDERLAAREWPGESPVGKRLALFDWSLDRDAAYEVVGVVEYVPQWDHWDQRPAVYLPRAYWPSVEVSYAVRMQGNAPPGFADTIRDTVRGVHPDLPVEMVDMRRLVGATMQAERFVMSLLATFAAVAMLLAAVGLYGVLSYGVRSRFREIGIRIALGAGRTDVSAAVVARGMGLAAGGGLLGLALALLLGDLLRQQLYEVAPRDPVALGATVAIVMVVTLCACGVPARRAANADPATVLREE